jgi:hypothetical protein
MFLADSVDKTRFPCCDVSLTSGQSVVVLERVLSTRSLPAFRFDLHGLIGRRHVQTPGRIPSLRDCWCTVTCDRSDEDHARAGQLVAWSLVQGPQLPPPKRLPSIPAANAGLARGPLPLFGDAHVVCHASTANDEPCQSLSRRPLSFHLCPCTSFIFAWSWS